MAKGKSTEKNKRDESAPQPRTSTRKKRIESSLASPIEEKTPRTSARTRVRKSKSEEIQSVDASPVRKTSKRIGKNKDAVALNVSLPPANDAPQKRGARVASNLEIKDDVKPIKKTVRKRSDSALQGGVEESKKKSVAIKTDVLPEKKKKGKASRNAVNPDSGVASQSETQSAPQETIRRRKRKAASNDLSEITVKPRSKKSDKIASLLDYSLEAAPTEKKKRRVRRINNSETRLSESAADVVVSDEKGKAARSKKESVKSINVEPEDIKTDVKPSTQKTKRPRKSSKTREPVETGGDELNEATSEPKKKRSKITVSPNAPIEASEIDAKPRKKREKETDATAAVEKKSRVSRRRKQDDETETSSASISANVDVESGGSSRTTERDSEIIESQPTSEGATKKEEASRSEAASSQTSRPTARRKSSSSSRTQNNRVLSNQSPDFLVLSVVNSFWLCAQWVVSDSNLNRVRSAMGRLWHTSEPVLRVYRVDKNSHYATIRREHVSDVVVKLPVRIWYAPVDNPPSSFMVELGYLSRDGEFFTLSSSGVVETSAHFIDDSTPLPPPIAPRWGIAGSTQRSPFGMVSLETKQSSTDDSDFSFRRAEPTDSFHAFGGVSLKVGAEVVIKGRVTPGAILKIRDERVVPKPNGFFAARLELPERRHVYPIVATSYDGSETQTIILAIDRNTKTLETVFRDDEE